MSRNLVAVGLRSEYLDSAMNQMQWTQSKVTSWCEQRGLHMDSDKTELVIFTKKHKTTSSTRCEWARGLKLRAQLRTYV